MRHRENRPGRILHAFQGRGGGALPFASTATLALWRVRRMWGMLSATGIGVIAAVMLVCTVPLYSQVALTAGLRSVLTAQRESATITAHASIIAVTTNSVVDSRQLLNQSLPSSLPGYFAGQPQFSIQTQQLSFISPARPNPQDSLTLLGYSMQDAKLHAKLLQGRLPKIHSDTLEIAISPTTASRLNVHVGSSIIVPLRITANPHADPVPLPPAVNLKMNVVGLYTADIANDVFWHGASIDPVVVHDPPITLSFTALMSNDTFLSTLDSIASANKQAATFSPQVSDLYWYYRISTSSVSINQLDELIAQLQAWQEYISLNYSNADYSPDYPYVQSIDLTGSSLNTLDSQGTLERFRTRLGVVQIPVFLVLLQIVALVLFFIGMMTELLVERQRETIAILRSRGANRRQIFGSFMTQSIGLAALALVVGPLLSLLAVYLVAQRALPAQQQNALNIISRDPFGIIYLLRYYALAAVLLTIVTMAFAIFRAVRLDALAIRREAARTTARPLWQRLNLDIAAVLVAITGYVISAYVTNLQELNTSTNVLVVSPLTLIAPFFLVLAGILLLLRLFPLLLRLAARIATRGQGAAAMLALGQMSRAPRQTMRMTLLLALASAFTLFSLIFVSSQTQRTLDIAAYQVGSDFSGPFFSYDSSEASKILATDLKKFPGITSATIGYAGDATWSASSNPVVVQIRAVDADTFAQTAIWTSANSTSSLDFLMQQLLAKRSSVASSHIIPAIVDASTWQRLKLAPGKRFELSPDDATGSTLTYVALAQVQHIPTIAGAGILIDYQSNATIYQEDINTYLRPNYLWVRTSSDAATVDRVRKLLTSTLFFINPLADRYALASSLSQDPLSLDLLGELAIGATTALLLALVANLLASWLSARNRQTSFAILRALGTSPQQVAGVLTWEQGITYGTAILLGIAFGALLSVTVVPSLVFISVPINGFTSDISSEEFYALQHLLPVQLSISQTVVLALVILVGVCLVALGMMVRIVSQPSMSQLLRLNED